MKLNTIEELIEGIRQGKMVIPMDDEDRENEGDLIIAAEKVRAEDINFMAKHARGLVCLTLTRERCEQLNLPLMVSKNNTPYNTSFTVSIEAATGVTTGISAADRARTIQVAVAPQARAADIVQPGHIFPIMAQPGGVLRRAGHTEAGCDLARLAGFTPAAAIVEIMNEDGTMARLPQLMEIAKKFDLKLVSIEDLVAYRMQHDSLIEKKEDFFIQTNFGEFRLRAYKQTTNDQIHLALTKGIWKENEPVLVRVNSTLVNYDILSTLTNNTDKKLDDMFAVLNKEGKGTIVFINQQSQSLDILNRLGELRKLQTKDSIAKAPQIKMDAKDFGIGAQILHDLGIHKIKLMSNTKQTKRVGMIGYGLEITEYINY